MDDLKSVYKELTSVDIEEQKTLWDERAKGYYGEYLLLSHLYPCIDGRSKILMNINIPINTGKSTEIDLLMIHESGLYAFEVKNYKGTIYGQYTDETWTQYFRTQKNNCFQNPVKQNEYHIAALKNLFPDLPVYSFIVFTNINTQLRITGVDNKKTVICRIDEIPVYIEAINNTTKQVLDAEQIDSIFDELKQYAPICSETVTPDGEPIQFVEYVNKLKDDYRQTKDDYSDELRKIKKSERKKYKQKNKAIISVAGIICAVVIGLAIMVIGSFQLKVNEARKAQDIAEKKFAVYEKKFADFEQKFKEVKPLNGGDVTLEDNFFEVIDYSFKESKDFKDTIIFSCKIQVNGEYYGLRIHRNSSIIVQLKDGSVLEYSFSNTSRTFPDTTVASFAPAWYNNTAELPQVYIYTSSIDNISYIKLTNVTVNTQGNMLSNALPGIEFELYSAN